MTHTEHDALARSLLEINALQMENERLRKQVGVAVDVLAELVTSGVEFEDERIGYKVLQVPNSLLADAEVWLEAMKGESHGN